jgi:hypothetical protein
VIEQLARRDRPNGRLIGRRRPHRGRLPGHFGLRFVGQSTESGHDQLASLLAGGGLDQRRCRAIGQAHVGRLAASPQTDGAGSTVASSPATSASASPAN